MICGGGGGEGNSAWLMRFTDSCESIDCRISVEIAEGRGGIMVVETANSTKWRGGKIESLNLGRRKENSVEEN